MSDRIPFYDEDREKLRRIGSLIDQLDAALGEDDVAAISNLLSSTDLTYLGGYAAGLADREPQGPESSDPRTVGGAISGPGGAYDEDAVVLDITNAVVLEACEVAIMGAVRKGVLDPKPISALVLRGRINKTETRVQILFLMNEDGAAGIVTQLVGLSARAGWGPEFLERVQERMASMPVDPPAGTPR